MNEIVIDNAAGTGKSYAFLHEKQVEYIIDAIRRNLKYVKLPEQSMPIEIKLNIEYPHCMVTHKFNLK